MMNSSGAEGGQVGVLELGLGAELLEEHMQGAHACVLSLSLRGPKECFVHDEAAGECAAAFVRGSTSPDDERPQGAVRRGQVDELKGHGRVRPPRRVQ